MVKKVHLYFSGYKSETNTFTLPFYIKLLQVKGYTKYFKDKKTCMNLLLNDKELLKNTMKYEV